MKKKKKIPVSRFKSMTFFFFLKKNPFNHLFWNSPCIVPFWIFYNTNKVSYNSNIPVLNILRAPYVNVYGYCLQMCRLRNLIRPCTYNIVGQIIFIFFLWNVYKICVISHSSPKTNGQRDANFMDE